MPTSSGCDWWHAIRFRDGSSIALELGSHARGEEPIETAIAEPALDRVDELDREIAMRIGKLRLSARSEPPDASRPADSTTFVRKSHQACFGQPVEMLTDRDGRDANPAGELTRGLRPLLLEEQQHLIPSARLCVPCHLAKIPVKRPFATNSSRYIR